MLIEERRLPLACLVVLSSLGLPGCLDDVTGGGGVEVTDSAGVRLVLNDFPSAGKVPLWILEEEPRVEIGVVDGADEYQLFDVSDAVVLLSGGLALANRGTHELRYYDARGQFIRSVGGEGDGPGEFRRIQFLGRFGGDSLLSFDDRHRRASVFDEQGRFVRSFSLNAPTNTGRPSLAGVLSNGAIVIRENHPYIAGVTTTGPDRSPVPLLLSVPTGADRDTLGVFPGAENFVFAAPVAFWFSVRPVTFGRRLVSAAEGDRIAVAETDTFAIRIYGSDGALHQVVRQRRVPVPIETAEIVRVNDSVLSTVEDPRYRGFYREMFELMPKHETFPALSSIQLDRLGNLWVEEYRQPGDQRSIWQVFGQDGRRIARAEIPVELQVLDIGADYLMGIAQDELGVERILQYALEKTPR
jgi:hypothetical protein